MGPVSTCLGLAPSEGPTMPFFSMMSMILAARLYPTLSARWIPDMGYLLKAGYSQGFLCG